MSTISSATLWIGSGLIFTAKTGLNYRKLKKGEISKKEFWKNFRRNGAGLVGGIAGGSGGAAAGFAIGTALFPGVGSILGTIAGGVAGAIGGEKLSMIACESVEKKIAEAQEVREQERKKAALLKELEGEENNGIDFERYQLALLVFGFENKEIDINTLDDRYADLMGKLKENYKEKLEVGSDKDAAT